MSSQLLKDRAKALEFAKIADSHLKMGQVEQAEENFAQAFQIAQTFPDETPKGLPKNSISVRGQVLNAFLCSYSEVENYGSAVRVAQGIEDEPFKAWALTMIARRYAEVGQFDEAIQIAETIIDNEQKNSALGSIAYEYAKAEQSDEALKIAASIDNFCKNSALLQVVENYVAAGEFELAKQITEMIMYSEEEDDRWEAFNDIAYGYAKAGQFEQGIQFALSLDGHFNNKNDALWAIAYRYAEIGEFEQSLQMTEPLLTSEDEMLEPIAEQMVLQEIEGDRIFQIISVLKNEYDRKTVLRSIVYHYGHAENKADQLIKFAQSVNDESIKYKALEYLAKNFIDAKEYDKVAEIGRNIGIDKINITSWKFIIHP